MNAIKSLLAVSILAAAGAAHSATVATFDYSDTWTTYGWNSKTSTPILTTIYGTGSVIGSGVLDDSGTLTLTSAGQFSGTANAPAHQYDASETVVFTGTYNSATNTFSANSQQVTINSCVANYGSGCAGVVSTPAAAWGPLSISVVDGAVTTLAVSGKVLGQPAYNTDNYSFTAHVAAAPTVPVPAAAWLFGSGLLGLAGTARRRRFAA